MPALAFRFSRSIDSFAPALTMLSHGRPDSPANEPLMPGVDLRLLRASADDREEQWHARFRMQDIEPRHPPRRQKPPAIERRVIKAVNGQNIALAEEPATLLRARSKAGRAKITFQIVRQPDRKRLCDLASGLLPDPSPLQNFVHFLSSPGNIPPKSTTTPTPPPGANACALPAISNTLVGRALYVAVRTMPFTRSRSGVSFRSHVYPPARHGMERPHPRLAGLSANIPRRAVHHCVDGAPFSAVRTDLSMLLTPPLRQRSYLLTFTTVPKHNQILWLLLPASRDIGRPLGKAPAATTLLTLAPTRLAVAKDNSPNGRSLQPAPSWQSNHPSTHFAPRLHNRTVTSRLCRCASPRMDSMDPGFTR